MNRIGFLLLVVLLIVSFTVTLDGKTTRDGITLVTLYSGLPADAGTDDPFEKKPLLGVSVERVLARGLGVGFALRYSSWQDYMGMFYNVLGEFTGAWTFKVWSPSVYLNFHFNSARRAAVDPYVGFGVGIHLTSFHNDLTNYSPPKAANLDSQPFFQGFTGIRVFPFRRNGGVMRNFAFMAQANAYLGKDFRPFIVMLGISQGF